MSIDLSGLITKEMKEKERLEQTCLNVRLDRDLLIEEACIVRDRHRDELELGIPRTYSSTEFVEILQYIQDLRDLPAQEGFPFDVDWPVKPF